jgi:excisionase family DNA binding protein
MRKNSSVYSPGKKLPSSATDDSLIASEAVATMLGCSRDRVWALVRSNMIPFVRIGKRHIRFAPSKIRIWIDNGGLENPVKAADLSRTKSAEKAS